MKILANIMGKSYIDHVSYLGEEIVFQVHDWPWLLFKNIAFDHEWWFVGKYCKSQTHKVRYKDNNNAC